ncbi:response regulator transcription factor [Sphingobacterium sp.]|uniref:response regulator transcription factor n=1 Tax=Sphingobacterium sp. TaxID=341027 RepID=UPI0028972F4A|nr:response regulator transcription factor [Sphingobacterium sp.]
MKNYFDHAIVLDDHGLFADAFSLLLERYSLFDFVKACNAPDEFFSFLNSFGRKSVVIFLDYYLTGDNGLSLLSEIRRINRQAKIVFLTSAMSPFIIQTLKRYNPEGILSKSCSVDILKQCVEDVASGKPFLDPLFQNILSAQQSLQVKFTAREIELLKYFAHGETIANTAEKMFLSPHTVIAHRRKMMAKAECTSITHLLTFAKENGLL